MDFFCNLFPDHEIDERPCPDEFEIGTGQYGGCGRSRMGAMSVNSIESKS